MADNSSPASLHYPVLIGDIGGTNVRFSILTDAHAEPKSFAPVATADFASLEEAIDRTVLSRTSVMPQTAIVAVAAPVSGDAIDLTNADWIIKPKDVIAETGIGDVIVLNDFEALALALTWLKPEHLEQIGKGEVRQYGTKVVLGPGTGLGVAGLIHAGNLWIPVPGEGGHVALGPAEPDEVALWPHIEREKGRISAEALLSGRGLVRLYRAVVSEAGEQTAFDAPAAISEAGLAKSDPCAQRTLDLYARLLGRVSGDMALVFMATGGVYLGGGIAPQILPVLHGGAFRSAFEAKAPHADVMERIPTFVISGERPALTGLAAFARTPARFGLEISSRRWTQAA